MRHSHSFVSYPHSFTVSIGNGISSGEIDGRKNKWQNGELRRDVHCTSPTRVLNQREGIELALSSLRESSFSFL